VGQTDQPIGPLARILATARIPRSMHSMLQQWLMMRGWGTRLPIISIPAEDLPCFQSSSFFTFIIVPWEMDDNEEGEGDIEIWV
jgi:hypothetical protein